MPVHHFIAIIGNYNLNLICRDFGKSRDIQHKNAQNNDTLHKNVQHNDNQHNDTQHNDTWHNDTWRNDNWHFSITGTTQ
jgi:hypothetical protein